MSLNGSSGSDDHCSQMVSHYRACMCWTWSSSYRCVAVNVFPKSESKRIAMLAANRMLVRFDEHSEASIVSIVSSYFLGK